MSETRGGLVSGSVTRLRSLYGTHGNLSLEPSFAPNLYLRTFSSVSAPLILRKSLLQNNLRYKSSPARLYTYKGLPSNTALRSRTSRTPNRVAPEMHHAPRDKPQIWAPHAEREGYYPTKREASARLPRPSAKRQRGQPFRVHQPDAPARLPQTNTPPIIRICPPTVNAATPHSEICSQRHGGRSLQPTSPLTTHHSPTHHSPLTTHSPYSIILRSSTQFSAFSFCPGTCPTGTLRSMM